MRTCSSSVSTDVSNMSHNRNHQTLSSTYAPDFSSKCFPANADALKTWLNVTCPPPPRWDNNFTRPPHLQKKMDLTVHRTVTAGQHKATSDRYQTELAAIRVSHRLASSFNTAAIKTTDRGPWYVPVPLTPDLNLRDNVISTRLPTNSAFYFCRREIFA